ncbi:hypothetical protein KA036_00085 [Candidatus Gracilibacteria bacterium]|jgi:hypothetical protein|nr:hypothetical protein [Candidatus Gracilibacteria bacterium]
MTGNRRRTLAEETKTGAKILGFGLGLIIVLSLCFFLLNLSKAAYKGYSYRQKEIQLSEQIDANNRLKVQTLEAKSYDKIEESEKFQEMTQPQTLRFIENRIEQLTLDTEL